MRSRRRTTTVEFAPPDLSVAAEALVRLRQAGSGWMNLLPGVPEDFAEPEPSAGLFAFFGNRAEPVTMATVVPPKRERRGTEGLTVGLMHPTGAKAVARLDEYGVALPPGWVVRQDHPRRGLLVRTAASATEDEVLDWSIRAATALCRAPLTGQWRAVIYLP